MRRPFLAESRAFNQNSRTVHAAQAHRDTSHSQIKQVASSFSFSISSSLDDFFYPAVLMYAPQFGVTLCAGLPLLPSFSEPPFPLLCGPAVIVPRPLSFTLMSPHLCLIVSLSPFLTQSAFKSFFLLAPSLCPHSSFVTQLTRFSPSRF